MVEKIPLVSPALKEASTAPTSKEAPMASASGTSYYRAKEITKRDERVPISVDDDQGGCLQNFALPHPSPREKGSALVSQKMLQH